MQRIFFAFLILYPFMIYPIDDIYFYHMQKYYYLTGFTLLIIFVFLYKTKTEKIKLSFQNFGTVEISFSLYFLFIILSTIFSVDLYKAVHGEYQRNEGLSALFCYGSLFLLSIYVTKSSLIKRIFNLLTSSATLVCIHGILQHFHLDFIPRQIEQIKWTRSYAFFDNPNFFGSYIVLMMLIAISLFFINNTIKYTGFYLGSVLIMFIAVIYSMTRSAWLGIFFVLLILGIFIIVKKREFLKKYVLLGFSLSILLLIINYSEDGQVLSRGGSVISEAADTVSGDENSANSGSGRVYLWKHSLPLIKENFFLGSGPDTFYDVFPQEKWEELKGKNHTVDKAHNEYLQIAVTLGVPALIAYLVFLTSIILPSVKAVLRFEGEKQILMLGLLLAIIGYLIQAFFNISTVPVAPYFWIFLGMAYKLSKDANENNELQKVTNS